MGIVQRIKQIFKRTSTPWRALSEVEPGYWRPVEAGEVHAREVALTIPAVEKALTLYTNAVSSYPLKVYQPYRVGTLTGRREATSRPEYRLLSSKPNARTLRTTLWKGLVDDYWWEGEAFFVVRLNPLGEAIDLHRLPASDVHLVDLDPVTGEKRYHVRESYDGRTSETRIYPSANERVGHAIRTPDKYGLRGVGLLHYAAEALGLHRQILSSGKAYYRNAVRPSGWLTLEGRPNEEAIASIRKNFKEAFAGSNNTGDVPALVGGKFEQLQGVTAEDAQILAALASSTPTVAMLFNLVPSDLGDQSQSKYASVAADRADQISRAFRPVLDVFECVLNDTLFPDGDYWCEFDTDEALRGSPDQFTAYINAGIQAGYVLRSEARDWLGLAPVEGLDVPLYPLNQGPEMGGGSQPDPLDLSKITPIVDKVVSGEYPPETGKTLILLAFPDLDQSVVDALVQVPQPQPQPTPEVSSAN